MLVAVVIGFLAAYALALVGAAIGSAILGVPLDGAGGSPRSTLPELIGRGRRWRCRWRRRSGSRSRPSPAASSRASAGIGLLVVQNIAGIFLPNVFKWFPFSAASAGDRRHVAGRRWRRRQAGLAVSSGRTYAVVVALWLIGALVLAALGRAGGDRD